MCAAVPDRPSTLLLAITGFAFTLSGVAALVYQVIWQRILLLHTGVGIASVALIVAAFMAGLGIGSHLGGVWSAKVDPRRALALFGTLELAIGGFAALSPFLLYDLLYVKGAWLYRSLWLGGPLHFAVLLVPTGLMGMSLPFLVRAAVGRIESAPLTIGFLYGVNVLGASLGALLTPWVLVPRMGLPGAIRAGIACNLLAGLCALVIAVSRGRAAAGGSAELPPAHEASMKPSALSLSRWAWLYALSGFCALALEVLWFRIVEVGVKSTAFTFGTVLALYLFGLGIGSLAGGLLAVRVERALLVFLRLQCLLLCYSALMLLVLARLPTDLAGYDWYLAYWSEPWGFRLGQDWNAADLARLYLLFPAALYLVPTFLMGTAFAVLQRAVQDDPRTSGRKVGLLQAANIAGNVAGSILLGLLLLEWLGTPGSMRVLLCCGLVFAAIGAKVYGGFAGWAAALAALVLACPSQEQLWGRLHGQEGGTHLVDEDATGVVSLVQLNPGLWRLFGAGVSDSSLPYGGGHTWLGVIPAVVHPAPRDVAIVGLGSGDTAWAAGCRRETERIRVFEIRAGQKRLLGRLAERQNPPRLRELLADPRLEIVVADGRAALSSQDRLYDLIEVDALYPRRAGSGMLYSREFYQLCTRRLKPGGVLCVWGPTERAQDTFRRVFPQTLVIPQYQILIGSPRPLARDVAAWTERLLSPRVRAYLDPVDPGEAVRLLEESVLVGRGLRHAERMKLPNLDLFPRDEFRSRE